MSKQSQTISAALFLALFVGMGCKSGRSSQNISLTGDLQGQVGVLIEVSIPDAGPVGKVNLPKALEKNSQAIASNVKANEEFAAMDAKLTKTEARVKEVERSIGYRIEMNIRAFFRWLKWIAIGWAVLGGLGFVLGKIPTVAGIGGILWGAFRLVNKFILGCIPHGDNAANLIGRISSIGVGDGSIARTPPI